MRNKLLLVLSGLLILVLLAGGCSADPLQSYLHAVKKTEQVNKGQMLVQFNHTMDFNGSGLTVEDRKNLEMFKEVEGTFTLKFDRDNELSMLDGHVDMIGMGFDLKAYCDEDRTVLMLPMFTKYLVVEAKPATEKEPVTGDMDNKLEALWNGMLSNKNVTREEGKLISTPEGEVKTTAYNVALSQREIEKLTRKYNGHTAVDEISLNIAKGELFGLLGPNGAGKSTTISVISTLLKPTAGNKKPPVDPGRASGGFLTRFDFAKLPLRLKNPADFR